MSYCFWGWEGWNALVAIGTLLLAGVTFVLVFWQTAGKAIWTYLRRPKLELKISNGHPDCTMLDLGFAYPDPPNTNRLIMDKTESFWIRFKVSNSGHDAAKQGEAYLNEIWRVTDDDTLVPWERHIPLNLSWSHMDLSKKTPDKAFFPRTKRGLDRYWDLGHIINPSMRNLVSILNVDENPFPIMKSLYSDISDNHMVALSERMVLLNLDTITKPSSRSYMLPPGSYILEILLDAENAELSTSYVQIEIPWCWVTDESGMLMGIHVEQVEHDDMAKRRMTNAR